MPQHGHEGASSTDSESGRLSLSERSCTCDFIKPPKYYFEKIIGKNAEKYKKRCSEEGNLREEVITEMSEKEKKEICEMVEAAKYLAEHDPTGLIIAKSNMDILKARADMEKREAEEREKEVV